LDKISTTDQIEINRSKVDENASDSCTRSGAFALLLSLALFSTIPYWLQTRDDAVLGRYISLRLSLATAVDQLDDSVNWKNFKASNKEAESMSIAQLLKARVSTSLSGPSPTASNVNPPATSDSKPQPPIATLRPAPPTNLNVNADIFEIRQVADFLTKLDDSELLTVSRQASGYFNYSIYRWAYKRNSLFAQNLASPGQTVVIGNVEGEQSQPENFVPPVGKGLLENLTVRDVRELAQFELPNISSTIKLGRIEDTNVELTPGSLPRNLYAATLSAEVLLFFVIMYFGAFSREAVSSVAFPSPGTLFSAFTRPFWTLVVFLLAIWTPFLASLGVLIGAWQVTTLSRKLQLILCSVLIGLAVLSIQTILQQKGYFEGLKVNIHARRQPQDTPLPPESEKN
jgi:hypothetical protein